MFEAKKLADEKAFNWQVGCFTIELCPNVRWFAASYHFACALAYAHLTRYEAFDLHSHDVYNFAYAGLTRGFTANVAYKRPFSSILQESWRKPKLAQPNVALLVANTTKPNPLTWSRTFSSIVDKASLDLARLASTLTCVPHKLKLPTDRSRGEDLYLREGVWGRNQPQACILQRARRKHSLPSTGFMQAIHPTYQRCSWTRSKPSKFLRILGAHMWVLHEEDVDEQDEDEDEGLLARHGQLLSTEALAYAALTCGLRAARLMRRIPRFVFFYMRELQHFQPCLLLSKLKPAQSTKHHNLQRLKAEFTQP